MVMFILSMVFLSESLYSVLSAPGVVTVKCRPSIMVAVVRSLIALGGILRSAMNCLLIVCDFCCFASQEKYDVCSVSEVIQCDKGCAWHGTRHHSECQCLNTFELPRIVVCLGGPDPYTTAVG